MIRSAWFLSLVKHESQHFTKELKDVYEQAKMAYLLQQTCFYLMFAFVIAIILIELFSNAIEL